MGTGVSLLPPVEKRLEPLLFIWLFAALFCGETLGLTPVHVKHRCHGRSFKIVNRWKKSGQDSCVLVTQVRQEFCFGIQCCPQVLPDTPVRAATLGPRGADVGSSVSVFGSVYQPGAVLVYRLSD